MGYFSLPDVQGHIAFGTQCMPSKTRPLKRRRNTIGE